MASLLKRINEYNAGIPQHLRDIKWKALAESAFRFFRGTDHLFAEDFMKQYPNKPKVKTWNCGDLHFENFGSYKSENRLVYFDLNDFDEAILASPEPEIARFLTSIIIAADTLKNTSLGLNKLLHDVLAAYVNTISNRKALMLESEVAHGVFKTYFERLNTRDRQEFIAHKTEKINGQLLLKIDNQHFLPLDNEIKSILFENLYQLTDKHHNYEHIVFADAAFRLAGTGSLGLQRYCVLCYNKKKGKHYLLDIKECRASCYTKLITQQQPDFAHDAERIITAGYLMQFCAPAFLAPLYINNNWFMVKELQPIADKMALADFKNDFKTFSEVAEEMAILMAYSHIRSSGHLGASTADDLRKFVIKKLPQKDIIETSMHLAQKNNKYYKEFIKK